MNESKYRNAEQAFWHAHGLEPSERFVPLAASGTRVRVMEVGVGDPVLFIHGGPNAGSTWVPLLEHFAGFRCLLVDRPGTGLSETYRLEPSALPQFGARFVGDLLDALGIDQADVVASSFGGHLALRSAAHDPSRFRRMVQMACPALVPGDSFPPFMKLISVAPLRRLITLLPPNERAGESILRQIGHGASLDAGRISPQFRRWSMDLQRYTDTFRNDFATIAGVIRNRERLTLEQALLASVKVPTRFLWGADDTFGDERVASRLVASMPDAELEMIPEAGHLPWIDFPRETATRTREFLAAAEGGSNTHETPSPENLVRAR